MNIKLTGVNKSAILLLSLEPEIAAKVFKLLDEPEIKQISQAMASLGKIDAPIIEQVVLDFAHEINATMGVIGNLSNTERFLRKVLGVDRANTLLEEIRGPLGHNIWEKLSKISPVMLAGFLKNEYPQTVALILTKISPVNAAKVVTLFSLEFAREVLKRMISMDLIKKDVLENIEKTLRSEFSADLMHSQRFDNNYVMAEIFNHFNKVNEEKFMSLLEEYNEEAAAKVKRLMFKFKDLLKIDSVGIQTLLKNVDRAKLILALKDAPPEIHELFMQNMSQRAYKLLLEEIEALGQVRAKDIEEARNMVVASAKEMLNKGIIKLMGFGDEEGI